MKKSSKMIRGGVGLLLMLILGAMYAWSYFKVALSSAYPEWSQTQITFNFTILISCFCLGGLLAGSALKQICKQIQVCLAAILLGAGFFGASLLPTDSASALLQLYLCYGVLTGLGTGIAYNAVLSGIQPWFPNSPGLISGVLLMGMGFGSLILGNIAAALIEVLSLSATFRIFATGTLIILLACAATVRPPRKDEVEQPAVVQGGKEEHSYTTAEMLRSPTFWFYFVWSILNSAAGMLVINSASSISVFYGLAAVIGLMVTIFNGLGRLVIGGCMDRLSWKKTLYLNNGILLCSGIVLLLGDRMTSGVIVIVGMLVMGISYGGGITISAALIRQLYGTKYYAANFSVCNLCMIPASVIGPMISAALQDGSGGYLSTFVMVIVLGVIALVLNRFIRKP